MVAVPSKSHILLKHASQPEALQLIPEAMARKYGAIPIKMNGNTLQVAMANPADIMALEALATFSHMRIEPVLATLEEIREAIDFSYKDYGAIEKQISNISLPVISVDERIKLDPGTNAPVAQVLAMIVDEAVKARASDIHFQPQEAELRVRYRIDGTLHDMFSLPVMATTPIVSRIKILANMNIADSRRPQDGQLSITSNGRQLDVRVGTCPTVHGEMAALRLLDKSRVMMDLSDLGFLPDSLGKFQKMLSVPYGMILVSGPTGSGKSTTLAAMIDYLNANESRRVVTVEDPIEYVYACDRSVITQRELGGDTLSFAAALKHVLRQDPDVILVGEMRDQETAAALTIAETGHLVLTTGHAPSSSQTIERIIDLFPPHERSLAQTRLASLLLGVLCQILVPRADGAGRVPAVEVMLATSPVRNLIRKARYTSCRMLSARKGGKGRSCWTILCLAFTVRA